MPNNGNTPFEDAARLTVKLVDHEATPDELSEVIMGTLLEMAYQVEMSQQTHAQTENETFVVFTISSE